MKSGIQRVLVVGGGNSAFPLICFLSMAGLRVDLLTRKPAHWQSRVSLDYVSSSGERLERFSGTITRVSGAPAAVVPDADVVFLAMPVSEYRRALAWIGPWLPRDRSVFLGTGYGQAGFDWMVGEMLRSFPHARVRPFALGLLPWICRTLDYGRTGITFGPKLRNAVATASSNDFEILDEHVLRHLSVAPFGQGEFVRSSKFLALTLSVDNQIIHPARMYALHRNAPNGWASPEHVPMFYRDFDQESAAVLTRLDAEYSSIRERVRSSFGGIGLELMADYLSLERWSYGSATSDVLSTFVDSTTLSAIPTPVVREGGRWRLPRDHRYFQDDIMYGLAIAKWIARECGLETPEIDRVVTWAMSYLRPAELRDFSIEAIMQYLAEPQRSGVPSVYGHRSLASLDT